MGVAMLLTTSVRADPLRVVAATNDLGAIADAIGGDRIHVEAVARPDRDLHSLEVRPSTMRLAARADVYLEVGMSLDLWSEGVIRGSRNRNLTVVDCAGFIEPLEVPVTAPTAAEGDVHPEGNPHYWLDPVRVVAVGVGLADVFASLDPEHAAEYRSRAEALETRVEEGIPAWREQLDGAAFIETHRTWVYFAERFGVRVVAQVEPKPGIPPSARHLSDLADTIRRTGVRVVVREPYHPTGPIEFLARNTDARELVLASSCEEPTWASYEAHFGAVVAALADAKPRAATGDREVTPSAG